jgi:hypothetical protein
MAQDKRPSQVAPNAGSAQTDPLAKKLQDWQETVLEGQPAKLPPSLAPITPVATIEKTKPEVLVVEPVFVPEYPKDLYTEAQIENEHRDFNQKLIEARAIREKPEYKPPPVPPAVIEQTRLEMEAGAKRVAEFEQMKKEQKALARVPDKWEGKTVEVFRPPDFREYTSTFKSPAMTVSKENLKK